MSELSTPRPDWKTIRVSFAIAGAQVAGALLLTFARKLGWIDSETVTRGAMVIIGLGIAAIGNMMPKTRDGPPPPTLELAALRQRVLRVSGWALLLGGLMFAGLSAFAPPNVAPIAAMITLGGAMAVMLVFVIRWIVAYHRAPPT
jgi:hypothetical protein